jgi:parallel beta-helix repeat protein
LLKKVLSLTFITGLICLGLISNGHAVDISKVEFSTAIYVPEDFATIQEAINNASAGDTIFVASGVYFERVVINKTVKLVGEDKEDTVVDGSFLGSVFKVTADNVSVSCFKLQNTGWKWGRSGVDVYKANNCEIKNNIVYLTCHQIHLNFSKDSKIIDNIVSAPADPFPQSAYGIRLDNSKDCLVENNMVSYNIGGVHLQNATNCTVGRNTIFQNSQGIRLYTPCIDNKIIANTVSNNTYDGMIVDMPENKTLIGNSLIHNNFINNSKPFIYKIAGCIWDNGFEGNYWSRYNGSDLNRDGIGDSAYDLGKDDRDQHPLIGIFSSFDISTDNTVNIISNSTITSLEFLESNNTIKIFISNSTTFQLFGFCRVLIPHELVSEPYNVTINGVNPVYWNYSIFDDGENRMIYFIFEHSTLEVIIVPEFPLNFLAICIALASALIFICRRKTVLFTRGK